jgi:hypothetical protein
MKKMPISEEISVDVDGVTYTASYTVSSKVVTVDAAFGSGSTQIGGSSGKIVARLLLMEIVQGAKDRDELK